MATQESLFLHQAAAQPEAVMLPEPKEAAPVNGSGGTPFNVHIQDPGVDLARKTVCIKVRLSTMGNIRKVSTSQIEADADKDLLRVSKHLIDSAELKAIGRFDGEIRRYLYNICLPFEIGIHLLPIAALEQVEQRLRQFAVDRVLAAKPMKDIVPDSVNTCSRRPRDCKFSQRNLDARIGPRARGEGAQVSGRHPVTYGQAALGMKDFAVESGRASASGPSRSH